MKYRQGMHTALIVILLLATLALPATVPVRGHAADAHVTLTYWDDDTFSAEQHQLDPIMEGFSKQYPNVTVKIVHGQNLQKLLTAIASGNAPDVFNLWDGSEPLGSLAASGALMSLDTFIKSSHFDIADQVPSAMQTVTYRGAVYGLPWVVGLLYYFYNSKDFKAAGISSPPITTGQLWQDAGKLTVYDHGHQLLHLGQVPPASGFGLYTWIANFGGSLYDARTHQVTPDNPGVLAALNDLAAQYKAYGPQNIDRFSSSLGQGFSPNDPLFTGQTAMRLDGDWEAFGFQQYRPSMQYSRDWGSFAVPYPDGHANRKGTTYLETNPMVIPAHAQHPKEAWEFLQYITSGSPGVLSALANPSPPASLRLLRDPRIAKLAFWQLPLNILQQSANITTFPVLPNSQHYEDVLTADVSLVVHGKESALAAMQHVKSVIQPELDQFYRLHPGQE